MPRRPQESIDPGVAGRPSLLAGRVAAGGHGGWRGGRSLLGLARAQSEAGGGNGEEEQGCLFHGLDGGSLWLIEASLNG